jgi:Cof subfamily protein (haloacid dehalogenase superfamily)
MNIFSQPAINDGVNNPKLFYSTAQYARPSLSHSTHDTVHFGNAAPAMGQPIAELASKRARAIKTVFVDIDGTLCDHDEDKNLVYDDKANQQLIDFQKSGGLVVISTGRSYPEAMKVAETVGLDLEKTYFIVEQGTRLIGPNNNVIHTASIDADDLTLIIKTAAEGGLQPFVQLFANGKPHTDHPTQMDRYNKHQPIERVDFLLNEQGINPLFAINPPNKIVFDLDTPDEEQQLIAVLKEAVGDKYHVKRTAEHLVELFSKQATKGDSAIRLAKHLRGDDYKTLLKQSANLGDGDNDSELSTTLSEHGGVSIAMSNGSDALKATSQYITGNVNEGGFAEAMEAIAIINEKAK